MNNTYNYAGLMMNKKKTEVLKKSTLSLINFSVVNSNLGNEGMFTYFDFVFPMVTKKRKE